MRIILENTDRFVTIEVPGGGSYQARVWAGVTEAGVPVAAIIPRVVCNAEDSEQFDRELRATAAPVPVGLAPALFERMVLP